MFGSTMVLYGGSQPTLGIHFQTMVCVMRVDGDFFKNLGCMDILTDRQTGRQTNNGSPSPTDINFKTIVC